VISIVLPVFNAEKYLAATINSLLNQSYPNFELIAIDDGSIDKSLTILESFSDPRIKVFQNEQNRGIVYTRNRGLAIMQGDYYAPFDADDLAHPNKLEKQLEFLEENPDFGMVGSWVTLIDDKGRDTGKMWKLKASPEMIPSILVFKNYFAQSSLLIRKIAIPPSGYENYSICQDYDMWCEIAKNWKTWNLPEYLIKYRLHTSSITNNQNRLLEEQKEVIRNYLNSMELVLSIDEVNDILPETFNKDTSGDQLLRSFKTLKKLIQLNQKVNAQPQQLFIRATWKQWLRLCVRYFIVKRFIKK
jgi:glycosyltransferase involved in cell wall biosynthesis